MEIVINCLTFFYCGASTHLIDGKLARDEGLQLISSNCTALGIIGGGSVKTEYGSFRFNMDPGEDGKYHESTGITMDDETAGFRKYKQEEICEEFR